MKTKMEKSDICFSTSKAGFRVDTYMDSMETYMVLLERRDTESTNGDS